MLQVWFETEPVQVELERLGYIQRLAEPVVVDSADILVGPATAVAHMKGLPLGVPAIRMM